ncbi:uncharacterized protein LOC130792757 [Actinidia eriantha]|uniref:uncharacterized protein LOC130792757 n=1 Tax=Actinidia eriantha TaxID=165200 RepID=UPI00258CEDFF|nr:uncharacterized protein LOC130792757 [Actinidia eriantha]XP_057510300.1 uncharacterized protein LOC130792757 [Actinidia eriantha]XP_057510301.1 uncharacterized protein LOC130792757 [Actinidia eriantha]XP_057510302.1 uncharacterized protein LOC130792757 [Actinidia eriantha]
MLDPQFAMGKGKGKGKNKSGGSGAATFKAKCRIALGKEDAATESLEVVMERTAQGSSSGIQKEPNADLLETFVEGSEGDEREEGSESTSRTLGENDTHCTPGVQRIAPVGISASDGLVAETNAMEEWKAIYASDFDRNRPPSMGCKLEYIETGDGPVQITADDVKDSPFKFCLVGYFGGRFPGKPALKQIVDAWKVPVNTYPHDSGWIVFQFERADTQMKVLENGPYIIYGRSLLLKIMPQFFRFENEEILASWI